MRQFLGLPGRIFPRVGQVRITGVRSFLLGYIDLTLLIVGPELLSVLGSWHQTPIRPLYFVSSRSYHPLDHVGPLPVWPENSSAGLFSVVVNFPED